MIYTARKIEKLKSNRNILLILHFDTVLMINISKITINLFSMYSTQSIKKVGYPINLLQIIFKKKHKFCFNCNQKKTIKYLQISNGNNKIVVLCGKKRATQTHLTI